MGSPKAPHPVPDAQNLTLHPVAFFGCTREGLLEFEALKSALVAATQPFDRVVEGETFWRFGLKAEVLIGDSSYYTRQGRAVEKTGSILHAYGSFVKQLAATPQVSALPIQLLSAYSAPCYEGTASDRAPRKDEFAGAADRTSLRLSIKSAMLAIESLLDPVSNDDTTTFARPFDLHKEHCIIHNHCVFIQNPPFIPSPKCVVMNSTDLFQAAHSKLSRIDMLFSVGDAQTSLSGAVSQLHDGILLQAAVFSRRAASIARLYKRPMTPTFQTRETGDDSVTALSCWLYVVLAQACLFSHMESPHGVQTGAYADDSWVLMCSEHHPSFLRPLVWEAPDESADRFWDLGWAPGLVTVTSYRNGMLLNTMRLQDVSVTESTATQHHSSGLYEQAWFDALVYEFNEMPPPSRAWAHCLRGSLKGEYSKARGILGQLKVVLANNGFWMVKKTFLPRVGRQLDGMVKGCTCKCGCLICKLRRTPKVDKNLVFRTRQDLDVDGNKIGYFDSSEKLHSALSNLDKRFGQLSKAMQHFCRSVIERNLVNRYGDVLRIAGEYSCWTCWISARQQRNGSTAPIHYECNLPHMMMGDELALGVANMEGYSEQVAALKSAPMLLWRRAFVAKLDDGTVIVHCAPCAIDLSTVQTSQDTIVANDDFFFVGAHSISPTGVKR